VTIRFQAERVQRCPSSITCAVGADRRDGETYVYYHPDISLAVNVALITGRPLLVEGPSGCGKSTLALNVALSLGWRYYEHVVTNRSEAQDLLWSMDNIRRLNDAQVQQLQPHQAYVEPGILWWALDPSSAARRGAAHVVPEDQWAEDPNLGVVDERAVVLIDEIDKADPDMPNGLLVPLGSQQFTVMPCGFTVRASVLPLVVITTNNERELPRAFLRRCVILELPNPDVDVLVEIAQAVDQSARYDEQFLRDIARHVMRVSGNGQDEWHCSTAEFLDTVRACHELGLTPDHDDFQRLTRITLRKSRRAEERERWA
jgi:MoxR-like ATPase